MKKFTLLALAMLSATTFSLPVQGQDFESVRDSSILTGWRTSDGTHMAAFQIELNEGWKTYWRAPGETGIPPRFDWSGSENVASVDFHWPRPGVHDNAGVRTIGYKDELVLPVEITPIDPSQPIELSVQMQLGVCEVVCIPLTLMFDAHLSNEGGPANQQKNIRTALARQPETARIAGIGDVKCTAEPISDGVSLNAEIPSSRIHNDDVVIFELPDKKIWISPVETQREGGRMMARADFVPPNAAPFSLDRSDLRITVIGENRAIDIQGCRG